MKKGGLIVLMTASFFLIAAKCEISESMKAALQKKLQSYTFLNEHVISLKKSKKDVNFYEVPMTFNRGITYKFFLADNKEFDGEMIVSVYGKGKADYMIASNYNNSIKKRYTSFEFKPKTSFNGVIKCNFEDGNAGCSYLVTTMKQ